MKPILLVLLSTLYLSACDGGSSSGAPPANTPAASTPPTDSGGDNQPEPANTGDSEPSIVNSLIKGNITVLNDSLPTGEIMVQLRGTNVTAARDSNGDFVLEIPPSDTDRPFAIDIVGDAIVKKSVSVEVPAQAELVVIDATVTASTPPITFNLETGGKLKNDGSPTRTNVTVPANAFQFDDGTIATGDAQVSITEIDITDLYNGSAWVPNLIGIAEGMTEPSAIITFGMSDFRFSQDGQELQLRPGVEATITMDLVTPYVMSDVATVPIDATVGAIMPLWHYDTEDMIWKEEGEALVAADSESTSGYSMSGQVNHFSTWNVDYVTPFTNGIVDVIVVDQTGQILQDAVVNSYTTTVRIPPKMGLVTMVKPLGQIEKI